MFSNKIVIGLKLLMDDARAFSTSEFLFGCRSLLVEGSGVDGGTFMVSVTVSSEFAMNDNRNLSKILLSFLGESRCWVCKRVPS